MTTTTAIDGGESGPMLTTERIPPWMQLHCGAPFDLLDPQPDQVVVADLIRSICRMPRYLAHTMGGTPYSVGQHCLLVADLLEEDGAPPVIVREGLLHDLPEGVYGDWPSPVKAAIRDIYHRMNPVAAPGTDPLTVLTRKIDRVVRERVGLPEHEHALAKRADLIALAIERRDLMNRCERDWQLPEFARTTKNVVPEWDRDALEKRFVGRLAALDKAVTP